MSEKTSQRKKCGKTDSWLRMMYAGRGKRLDFADTGLKFFAAVCGIWSGLNTCQCGAAHSCFSVSLLCTVYVLSTTEPQTKFITDALWSQLLVTTVVMPSLDDVRSSKERVDG